MYIKKFIWTKIVTALLLAYIPATAQHYNVPTKFSTPRGNITVYERVYMPHYQNYETVSNKHFFTIILRNDSVITKKAKIVTKDSVHTLSWNEKGEKKWITPAETKEITPIGVWILSRVLIATSTLMFVPFARLFWAD